MVIEHRLIVAGMSTSRRGVVWKWVMPAPLSPLSDGEPVIV
jgi:hypothetical protein